MAYQPHAHSRPQVIQGNFQGRLPAFTAQARPAFPQAAQQRRAPHVQAALQQHAPPGQAAQRRSGPPPQTAQPKRFGNAFQVPPTVTLSRVGQGRALPEAVRQQMESFFSADFSDVRIHTGAQAQSIGAVAFTMGSHLYFAPGQYNPTTAHGQRLLGHELAHVVQQRAGRVRNPFGGGVAVVQDPGMEAEAERMGIQAAARGTGLGPVGQANALFSRARPVPPVPSLIQRQIGRDAEIGRYVVLQDGNVAHIAGKEKASSMSGETLKIEMYLLKQNSHVFGYAHPDDPSFRLIPKGESEGYLKEVKSHRPTIIPLKTSVLQKPENGIPYRVEKERLYYAGKLVNVDKVPFVVTVRGQLLIGWELSGHSGLAKGFAVRMAGELHIKEGRALYYREESGHYKPSAEEEQSGLLYMKQHFPWIGNLIPQAPLRKIVKKEESPSIRLARIFSQENTDPSFPKWEDEERRRKEKAEFFNLLSFEGQLPYILPDVWDIPAMFPSAWPNTGKPFNPKPPPPPTTTTEKNS